jgi:hypothetical protein
MKNGSIGVFNRRLLKPWFVQTGTSATTQYPTGARDEISTLPAGSIWVELRRSPVDDRLRAPLRIVDRSLIDRRLVVSGWQIQSKTEINLGAGLGVAVREFQTASGPVDYGLFVGRKLCGVIEAKPAGSTLSGYSEQAARYIADVPKHLVREEGQVRFEYVASGTETLFRDHGDPDPASRRVFPCRSTYSCTMGGLRRFIPAPHPTSS